MHFEFALGVLLIEQPDGYLTKLGHLNFEGLAFEGSAAFIPIDVLFVGEWVEQIVVG